MKMLRQKNPPASGFGNRTLVLDNGGHTMKAGFVTSNPDISKDCHIIPNCIARSSEGGRGGNKVYIADQIEQCHDTGEMAFRRPLEKGFIVNWDGELDIWKQAFFNEKARLHCDPHDTTLLLTEAPNCPQALQANTDQMIFEEFEFASAYRCLGPSLNAWNDTHELFGDPSSPGPAECLLLVDSGYSHTTVTPLIYGRPVQSAIRRLEVGGKMLTNMLKELSSLRHWNLMDDSYLVSQIKEDTCYVSHDFKGDLEKVWNVKGLKSQQRGIIREYILPDYRDTFRGHVKSDGPLAPGETSLPLGNERFVVPELLFKPSDVGMAQASLPEVMVQSLSCLPTGTWPGMLANVVIVGGNAKLPGFVGRLETELRALTPGECILRVSAPADPISYTWRGGIRFASDNDRLKKAVVTKEEYQEQGPAWTARKFANALK